MNARFRRIAVVLALVSIASIAMTGRAQAEPVLVATLEGNDCSGLFGQGFASCAIPALYDPDTTPVIIKFNADGSVSDVNSDLFPTISGDEFSFSFGANGTGTWSYTPGAGDPATLVSFFVVKGGPVFNLFSVSGNTDNTFFVPLNPNNQQPYGLSHLTFYEGGQGGETPVPEPATLLLVTSGLLAAARLRHRARRNTENGL
jgi:hypothetical protein